MNTLPLLGHWGQSEQSPPYWPTSEIRALRRSPHLLWAQRQLPAYGQLFALQIGLSCVITNVWLDLLRVLLNRAGNFTPPFFS